MSENTKSTKNKRITKEDGDAYERYLYAKLMTITTMLSSIAEELLSIRASDLLASYQKDGVISNKALRNIVEDIMETNELPQADRDLRDEVDKKTRTTIIKTKDL